MHAPLPRPPRQLHHLCVLQVVPYMQLQRHDQALRRALRLRTRAQAVRRVRVGVQSREARRELPHMRRGQMKHLRVPFYLAHRAEERLHAPPGKPACRRSL